MSQNLDPTKSETSLPREMLCLRMLVRPKMTKATSDRATTNSKQFDRLMWVLRSELEDLWGLNPILWSGTSSVTSSSARRTKASVSWSLSSISRVATSPLVSIKTHQPNDFPPLNIFCPATTAVPTWALREGQEARLVTKDCVHEIWCVHFPQPKQPAAVARLPPFWIGRHTISYKITTLIKLLEHA